MSLLGLARALVGISGSVIRAFPLFILRVRLFLRARVEAGLVAVLRVSPVRDLLWGSGEDGGCEVSLGEIRVGGVNKEVGS